MPATPREELLQRMYEQMFNDINRHIMVVWQSIGVLVGAFAIFALTEKQIISVDIASSLVILIAGWSLAHLYDAGYWYNRNLAIIANIERQFLTKQDLHNIHYYFGAHRPQNRMIVHLRIQFMLGVGVGSVVLAFHFLTRVVPGFGAPWSAIDLQRTLPYLVTAGMIWYLICLRGQRNRSYTEFLKNSPGISVDTEGISYGEGHGFDKSKDV